MNRRGFMKNSAIVVAFPVSFLENSFKERSLKDSTFVLMRFERRDGKPKYYPKIGLTHDGESSYHFCGGESELVEIFDLYRKYGSRYDYNTYNSRKWLNHYCHGLGDNEKVSCECMFDRSRQSGYFTYDQLFEYLDCHSNSGEWEDGTEEENIELQKRWRYNMIMHYYVRDIKTGEIYSLESIINNS